MEIKINLDNWLVKKEILNLIKQETKQTVDEICNKESGWLTEVAAMVAKDIATNIQHKFINDERLRNLIISEFIKSMSDDEKKKLFLEALLITRK